MYLYFDKKGALREIINDEALRQGNYGVNKIYVYLDNGLGESASYDSIDVSYVLPGGSLVGPQNHDTFVEASIPYDQKRDLRYFKYGKTYNFCVIEMEPDVGSESDTFGDSPLQENGVVHCSMSVNLDPDGVLGLGDVNFEVEGASALELGTVGPEKYLSLANYQYLRQLIRELMLEVPLYRHTINILKFVQGGEQKISFVYFDTNSEPINTRQKMIDRIYRGVGYNKTYEGVGFVWNTEDSPYPNGAVIYSSYFFEEDEIIYFNIQFHDVQPGTQDWLFSDQNITDTVVRA